MKSFSSTKAWTSKLLAACLCSLLLGCDVFGGGGTSGPVELRIDGGTFDAGYYVVAKDRDTEGLCCSAAWGSRGHREGGGILVASVHPDSALVAYARTRPWTENVFVEVYRQDGGQLLDEVSSDDAQVATIRVTGGSLETEADLLGSVN